MSREEEPGLLGKLPRSRPGRRSEKRPDEPVQTTARSAPRTTEPAQREDRVGEAVRAATNAAGAGLRAANGMTRELLRRLPRRP